MNISHKFAFMHIPKTAGTSFRAHIAKIFPDEDIFFGNYDNIHDKKFSIYAAHYDVNFILELPSAWQRFSIIREPISRYISILNHTLRDPSFVGLNSISNAKNYNDLMSNSEFIETTSNNMTRLFSNNGAYHKYKNKIIDFNVYAENYNEDLNQAIENSKLFDFIGNEERLIDSINTILCKINKPPIKFLPQYNYFPNEMKLTPMQLDFISEINSKDIEFYEKVNEYFSDKFASKPYEPLIIQKNQNFIDLGNISCGSGWFDSEKKEKYQFNQYILWSSRSNSEITIDFSNIDKKYINFIFYSDFADSSRIKILINNIESNKIIVKSSFHWMINFNLQKIESNLIEFKFDAKEALIKKVSPDEKRQLGLLLTDIILSDEIFNLETYY